MDQFIGEDSQSAQELVKDQQRIFERRVVIKRFSSFTGGNTPSGTAPSRTSVLIDVAAKVKVLTGKDIMTGGGLFSTGDIEVKTQIPIVYADRVKGTTADEMLIDGASYILKGKPDPVPLGGGTFRYRSVWKCT